MPAIRILCRCWDRGVAGSPHQGLPVVKRRRRWSGVGGAGQQNVHSFMGAPPLLRQPSLGSGGGAAVSHGLQFQSALHDQLGISTLSLAGGGGVPALDRPERRPRLQGRSPLARTSPTATSPPLDPSPDWAQKASPLPVTPLRRRRSGMPTPPRSASPGGEGAPQPGSDADQPAPKKRRSGMPLCRPLPVLLWDRMAGPRELPATQI